jgi:carbamoyltransferase
MILGIWDGHDSGAALVENGKIIFAINEERLTRRKLEVGFPKLSIQACLQYANLNPSDINIVAASTSDFSKTLTRLMPGIKENYYLFRRRKIEKPRFAEARHYLKYKTTEKGNIFGITKHVSQSILRRQLRSMGFENFSLHLVDHHAAHAACLFTSGFSQSLVITLDGVGDKLSGTVNTIENGELNRLSSISAKDSLGIFFEQVTNLIGMRELEDEGKVMSMADYVVPIPDSENKFIDFFKVQGLDIKAQYSASKSYKLIKKVLWNTRREHVAHMAQKTIEKNMTQLFENAIDETGLTSVAWSGGLAANVKANMKIRLLPQVKEWFVFPHMGDGGLAAGAALLVNNQLFSTKTYKLENAYLGPEHDVEDAVRNSGLTIQSPDIVPELISKENYIFWYRGRMEYGPRALGNRSIIGPAFSEQLKDKLNLKVKMREWYQPFCPSLLDEEAPKLFQDADTDRFMTNAYIAKPEYAQQLKSVLNIDGSARPQMVGTENPRYRQLIQNVKKHTGHGIILNTSFNLHGYPIVSTPEQALEVMKKTRTRYMVMGDYLLVNEKI